MDKVLTALPETHGRWLINGTDGVSSTIAGVGLSEWKNQRETRRRSSRVQGRMGMVEGSNIFAFQLPPLPGSTGGLPVQMVIRSPSDHRTVYEAMESFKKAARESGMFIVVDSDLDFNQPVVEVRIDRSKANDLGITMRRSATRWRRCWAATTSTASISRGAPIR